MAPPVAPIVQLPHMEGEASFDDQPHYSAVAACGPLNSTSYRDTASPAVSVGEGFPNIRAGIMPFNLIDGGYYGVAEAISVAYQCYFNYAPLRNSVNFLADFSVSPIHVKTPNLRVKEFIEQWFATINLNQFMAQFFLEYYRSGNVFIYKFSGQPSVDGLKAFEQTLAASGETCTAARDTKIPIRYIILNPMQIYLQQGPLAGVPYTDMPYGWVRMLSTYEIQRLRNPQTPEDEQMLKSFPPEVQRIIKTGGTYRYLFVPLDTNRLFYVFYRKMDYEPLAVPFAFPVLTDIEFKLALRKMDMALAATIERVILLVTTGRPADAYNQVPPKDNLINLQNIFRNQTIGRVLVSDYTTKAQWVIPDFKELLGPDKYTQVDKDIKEGLQYTFFGEEKFANASIKVKIFIESLKEGRRAFMETFLMPEVKKLCESMGFRNLPELEFEEIQLQDEALMARLYVQMAQLGLLTDSELNEAMRTGMLPTKEESLVNQEEYTKQRKKGFYTPLAPPTGGDGSGGRPAGTTGTPATRKVATPIGQKKASVDTAQAAVDTLGRAESPYHFSITQIGDNLVKMADLRARVEVALAKQWKIEGGTLDDAQKEVAASIAQSIAFNEPEDQWTKVVRAYVKAPKELSREVALELIDIQARFTEPENPVTPWFAGVLAKSKAVKPA